MKGIDNSSKQLKCAEKNTKNVVDGNHLFASNIRFIGTYFCEIIKLKVLITIHYKVVISLNYAK